MCSFVECVAIEQFQSSSPDLSLQPYKSSISTKVRGWEISKGLAGGREQAQACREHMGHAGQQSDHRTCVKLCLELSIVIVKYSCN